MLSFAFLSILNPTDSLPLSGGPGNKGDHMSLLDCIYKGLGTALIFLGLPWGKN